MAENTGDNNKTKRCSISEWLRFGYERLEEAFQDNIPFDSVKELDFKFVLGFGLTLYAIYYAFFAYFMYEAYSSAIDNEYISLEHGSNCDTVPIVTTASYLADINGNWEGESSFTYSEAPFQLVLTSFSVDSLSKYSAMIQVFKEAMIDISEKTQSIGLIYSLIAWMTYVRYYSVDHPTIEYNFYSVGYGELQYMQLYGDAASVFNLRHTEFNLGTSAGVCDADSLSSNSPATYSMSVLYNSFAFSSADLCTKTLVPSKFDLYATNGGQFTFTLDTRSFATAMAINYGILRLTELAPVHNSFTNISVDGVEYLMGSYFDVRYAGMDPVICFHNLSYAPLFYDSHICTITKGTSTLGLPVFNHIGTSYNATFPSYCSSATSTASTCSQFKLMSGLVVFPPTLSTNSQSEDNALRLEQMTNLIRMLNSGPYVTYEQFNKASYNASFIITRSGTDGFESQYRTPQFFNESFEFCRINGSDPDSNTCSLLVFYQFDYSNNYVNEYSYRLENGSSASSITVTDECWDTLAANPPTSLVESYYECHPTVYDTLQNSQGVAAGNIDMAMMIAVPILFGPLVYFLLYRKNAKPENEDYLQVHKDELNDMVMNLLLKTMNEERLTVERQAEDFFYGENGTDYEQIRQGEATITNGERTVAPTPSVGEGNSNSTTVIKGIANNGPIMSFGKELYHYSQVLQHEEDIENQNKERCCFKKIDKNKKATLIVRAHSTTTLPPKK